MQQIWRQVRAAARRIARPAELPADAADYAALDVLVLAATAQVPGTSKSTLSQLSAEQQLALRDWVEVLA